MRRRHGKNQGFTLIELSIVLVIIGLIVGGVLVGQDLIGAAGVRATVAQVEKFNTAVNTFKGKFGYLPGDIPDPYASQFGFAARGQFAGEGDGDGQLEGIYYNAQNRNLGMTECAGETVMFWQDLSVANMIEGNFSAASSTNQPSSDVSVTGVTNYLPPAKLGNGNYIYVWSVLAGNTGVPGANYFGINLVTGISCQSNYGALVPGLSKGLTVAQAYAIDAKLDDGKPMSGNILAVYAQNENSSYAQEEWWFGSTPTACLSNQFNAYDTANYANLRNCALSFHMQGAAR